MIKVNFLLIATLLTVALITQQKTIAQDSIETFTPEMNLTLEQVPDGLIANDVIDNYLEAIGGREIFSTVKDRTTILRGQIMEQSLSIVIKQKVPNKLRQSILSGEMEQTILYDGTKGVMIIGDKKTELGNNELEKLKLEAAMNFLLDPEAYGVSLELKGIETVDSLLCYKIVLITDEGTCWEQFYDIDSGLKIKEVKEVETTLENFVQETYYSDYKEIDGLKFPYKIIQSIGIQTLEMNVSSVRLNMGLKDSIFEIPE
jgi:outer membrane lipoprotein-sorting protein